MIKLLLEINLIALSCKIRSPPKVWTFKVDINQLNGMVVISINCKFLKRDTNDIYFAKWKTL